jgi:hypothetical protein
VGCFVEQVARSASVVIDCVDYYYSGCIKWVKEVGLYDKNMQLFGS